MQGPKPRRGLNQREPAADHFLRDPLLPFEAGQRDFPLGLQFLVAALFLSHLTRGRHDIPEAGFTALPITGAGVQGGTDGAEEEESPQTTVKRFHRKVLKGSRMMDEFQFILHPSSFQARGATTGRGGWPGGSAGAGRAGAGPTSHNFTSPGDSLVPPALTSRRPSEIGRAHV